MSETETAPETSGLQDAVQAVIDFLPEGVPRKVVNALSEYRIEEGPKLAEELRQVPPEERTWWMGIKALGKGSTDFWDGILGRRVGPTESGDEVELDRRADRSFVMPQQEVLAQNGEVPPIHYQLKRFREGSMKVLRRWGALTGQDLKSLQISRGKTVVEMSALAGAHSPLSRHPDFMRWGAANGTGASINGLLETVFSYIKRRNGAATTARNSAAREITSGPFGKAAEFINEKFPDVTSDDITRIGKRMVEASVALATANPDHPVLPTAMYTVFNMLDGVDGAHARLRGEDGSKGMIEDVRSDLEAQLATLGGLAIIAMRRGNKVAAANYALAAMLTPLSAATRAEAESQGLIVAEGGMGTRVGRSIVAGAGMAFNRYRDISDILSSMLVSATADTVLQRRDVVRNGTDSKYCIGTDYRPEFMNDAKLREQAIMPYVEAGFAVGSTLLASIFSEEVQDRVPKTKRAQVVL